MSPSKTCPGYGLERLEDRQLLSVSWLPTSAAPTISATPRKSSATVTRATPARARRAATSVMTVAANVDATRQGGNEMEPQVAINPTNPNNVVMVAQNDVNG